MSLKLLNKLRKAQLTKITEAKKGQNAFFPFFTLMGAIFPLVNQCNICVFIIF